MSFTLARHSARLLAIALALQAAPRPAAAFDVLVGTRSSPRLQHVDGTTGAIEGFIYPGCDQDRGFQSSGGPRLGSDGKIYVQTNGAIYRLDGTTGELLDVLFLGVSGGAAFSLERPDGTLWVTVGPPGNALVHVDMDPFEVIGSAGTPYPVGIDVGPVDGNLYVGSFETNRITRHDPTTGALLGTFVQAASPVAGVAFLPDGRLCAVFPNLNEILCYDGATGAPLGSFIPASDPRPISPRGPALGPDGELWVSSNTDGTILRYDVPTGAFLGVFASGLDSPGAPGLVGDLPASGGFLAPLATTSGPAIGLLECGVRKYLGIPYAEAPSGALRWRRPVRKATAPAPFNAWGHGPSCPQRSGSSVVGSEDCLKLSIWRPDTPPATPLPVLFFIHGGALVAGSMGPVIDGTPFARTQNAIVVEAQYRLGALGFFGLPELAAEDANASTGNYGLLDQLEALAWVRDNIAGFGGDPNQVTVAGQSAGGAAVCALMASPLSDGLFRAAIVQSAPYCSARPLTLPAGSPALSDPLNSSTIYGRSAAVATSAGCPAGAGQLACLRARPASSLVQALAAQPATGDGSPPANPALDGYVLSEQPLVMLRQGAADQRPLMIGSVANESTYYTVDLEWLMTSCSMYESAVRALAGNTRADAILPLYPCASQPTPAEALRVLLDDAQWVWPTLDVADAVARGLSSAFAYHLTFAPTYGPSSTQSFRRTFHGLDLYYVFGTHAQLGATYGIVTDADDAALSDAMQEAWGSFVRTGVPSTAPAWPVFSPATPGDLASVSVLQFDVPNTVVSGDAFRSGRCAALAPVVDLLDPDRDIATYDYDNCPTLANSNQADAESDAVGDVCDNCTNVANARVAADFLTLNPWATLTGGQRDDDHDGYGNKCDAKFVGLASQSVGGLDLGQFRASSGEDRRLDTCGTSNTRPCAVFDLDESASGNTIGGLDLGRYRELSGRPPGPRCAACTGTGSVPLPCAAGTAASCD